MRPVLAFFPAIALVSSFSFSGLVMQDCLAASAPVQDKAGNQGQEKGRTLTMSREHLEEIYFDAARKGRNDIIEGLIAQGFGPNLHDKKGYTPLILAAYNDHLDTVNLLIEKGADACGKDLKGNTALMGAAFKGESGIVRRLSEAGCPVNTQNIVGQTALMMASLFGQTDAVRTLLSLGADPLLVDGSGQTAMSLAAAQDNMAMVRLLEAAIRKPAP